MQLFGGRWMIFPCKATKRGALMYEALEEIIRISKEESPEYADYFTLDWARKLCSDVNKPPDQVLSEMKSNRAAIASIDYEEFAKESEKKKQENPEYYDYYTGHIDTILIELEKEHEEKNNVDSKK